MTLCKPQAASKKHDDDAMVLALFVLGIVAIPEVAIALYVAHFLWS